MAQILNADPQTNPRLREIYEILLLAGYFRIRIASLKPFDKVLGGLAWAITCSNFQVDVEYNDEMQIGQKIKVSEKVCDALKKMRCPHAIQPFQIQGLDLNSIYPVVQWLIKFVYQTRQYRQKFNTVLSNFLGEQILKLQQPKGKVGEIDITAKRLTKNAYIKATSRTDPLRVYSTLIEFGDVTSTAAYNKLCAIVTGKVPNPQTIKQQQQQSKQAKELHLKDQHSHIDEKKEFSLASYLFETKATSGGKPNEEEAKIIEKVHQEEKNNFKRLERKMSFSGAELEKLVVENREKIEEALKTKQEDEESPELQLTKILATENETFESQKQFFTQRLAALQRAYDAAMKRLEVVEDKAKEVREQHQQQVTKLEEIEHIRKEVEQELKTKTKLLTEQKNAQLEKNVELRLKLKAEKTELKKTFKSKLEELKKQKVRAQQSIPEVDEQIFNKMLAETKVKKRIYDEKFLEMTLVNQELAVLQRKAQNYTSPTEIAQYQQRFLELIQSINLQIETKKDLYAISSHLQSLRQMVNNYVEVMRTFKENYVNSKKKDEKKEFIDNLKEVFQAMQNNLRNSETVLKKVTDGRSSNYQEYIRQVKMEREFYMVLKQLKNEVELAEYEAAQEAARQL